MSASVALLPQESLSWVFPEIVSSLDEVAATLEKRDWSASATRIGVTAHLHQVTGALRMVDLRAPERLAAELEVVFALHGTQGGPDERSIAALQQAIISLHTYLRRVLDAQPVRPHDLLPALMALGDCHDQHYHIGELFFPELTDLPAGSSQSGGNPIQIGDIRATFQRGLMNVLRAGDRREASQVLVNSLRRAAKEVPGHFGAFRWLLLADLISELPPEGLSQQRPWLTRIDRQLRATLSQDDQPNDALVREALFVAAQLEQPGPALQSHLRAARVVELLAPNPAPAPTAVIPEHIAQAAQAAPALVRNLQQAEELLEAWWRRRAHETLPASLAGLLQQVAAGLDALGDDSAMLLLDEVRARMATFGTAASLSEVLLEPVVELLAGLQQYALALARGDADADSRLDALREARLPTLEPAAASTAPDTVAAALVDVPELVAPSIDESLFGVFLEEADVLLRWLHRDARPLALGAPGEQPVVDLRRHLHTLRSSGLMTGLLPIAQLCGELDHTLAALQAQGALTVVPGTPASERCSSLGNLLEEAATEMERWLARLAGQRNTPLQAIELIDRARTLRADPTLSEAPLISLQDIFLEEAGARLSDLQVALDASAHSSEQLAAAHRAAHTLAGIARTAEHPALAELAAALEDLLHALRTHAPLSGIPSERLRDAVRALLRMHADLVQGKPLTPAPMLIQALQLALQALPLGYGTEAERPAPASPTRTAPAAAPPVAQAPAPSAPALPAVGHVADPALHDQLDADLLPVFLEEANELLPLLEQSWRDWSAAGPGQPAPDELKRGLHTLKGSARMAGAMRQGELAHQLEDVLSAHAAGADANVLNAVRAGLDGLAAGIDALAHPDRVVATHVAPMPAAVAPVVSAPPSPEIAAPDLAEVALGSTVTDSSVALAEIPPALPGASAAAVAPAAAPAASGELSGASTAAVPAAQDMPGSVAPPLAADISLGRGSATSGAPAPAKPGNSGEAEGAGGVLRVKLELLDRMANAAGETGIARARIESEALGLKRTLAELADNVQRLKNQLREVEIHAERALPATLADGDGVPAEGDSRFDPLEMDRYSRLQELTRTLAEGIDDVQTVHHSLRRNLDDIELALRQQGRVVRDLQQDLLRARMVPFASLTDRLQRTVRQAARDAGCELELELRGSQHEVDRTILERLAAPLEHILRNAAVHAIEPAAQRVAAGKSATGRLRISLTPTDHEVEIRVSDDGRGIDLKRIQAHAATLDGTGGAAVPREEQELLQLIFRPGFSTADSVTALAGRGVGLDVVRSEVLGLGGRIHVDTHRGVGTEFTLVIPVTLATVQAVVVRAGETWFAIPAPLVEQIRVVHREEFATLHAERAASWQGLRYPLGSLRRVLGEDGAEVESAEPRQLLFLRSADRRCALYVDELAGTQEIVVKAVSPHLTRLPGMTGASVLGNGRIVLIMNPVPLAVGLDGLMPSALQSSETLERSASILVVDDSLTVRRVTSRVLERAGYQVVQARDGIEALDMIAASRPAAVLLDVEMPRMDGFTMMRRLREQSEYDSLPVVMITSRTAARHREHAAELNVQGYLGKPFREEELLALLGQLAPLKEAEA